MCSALIIIQISRLLYIYLIYETIVLMTILLLHQDNSFVLTFITLFSINWDAEIIYAATKFHVSCRQAY